jgi:high-affinity nickel permease
MRRTHARPSVFEPALLGAAIGLRHALEADHRAAVATLVEDDASARTGAA